MSRKGRAKGHGGAKEQVDRLYGNVSTIGDYKRNGIREGD